MNPNTKKALELLLAVAIVLGLVWLVFWSLPKAPVSFQVQDNVIALEIADSDAERRQGLSGREHLAPETGMLFVFRRAGYHAFWMPDMRFSLDIVWMDKNFLVVDIEEGVTPDTYPKLFYPSQEASFVLELNAGQAKEYGITTGSRLTPIFSE